MELSRGRVETGAGRVTKSNYAWKKANKIDKNTESI